MMLSLIDELENLVQRALRVPASGKILVDEAALREIIDQLRLAVPDEVQMGQRIAAERERILADAKAHARRMTEEAQAQVNSRVDDQGIVQVARQRARDIQVEAEQKANDLRVESNKYVSHQLGALEYRLQRLLNEVQAGQKALVPQEGGEESSGQN
jgi:hypothetical protein